MLPLVRVTPLPHASPRRSGARTAGAAPRLRRLLRRVSAALTAAAFAEERDAETARRLAADDR